MSRFEWALGTVLTLGLLAATLYSLTPGHPVVERVVLFLLTLLQAGNFVREVVASRCVDKRSHLRPVRLSPHASRTIQTASDRHLNRTGEHHGRETDDGKRRTD